MNILPKQKLKHDLAFDIPDPSPLLAYSIFFLGSQGSIYRFKMISGQSTKYAQSFQFNQFDLHLEMYLQWGKPVGLAHIKTENS